MEGTAHAPIASSPIDACRGRGKHASLSYRKRSFTNNESKKTDTIISSVVIYLNTKDESEQKYTQRNIWLK